jgi:hypothetical protein
LTWRLSRYHGRNGLKSPRDTFASVFAEYRKMR